MILERPWPNHSTKDSIKKSCVCSARCAVPCKAAKKLTSFGKSGVLETVLGTGWAALFIFAGELWGNSCLRARWWSGTQKVDEVEAEQQPAFCQGQATHMGACCCQVNKSPAQHPPSCASCLKCYCTSFPVAVMGPVFIQWDVSYANFQSDAWSAVPAQTRGDRCLAGQVRSLKAEGCLCKQEMIPSCGGMGYPGYILAVCRHRQVSESSCVGRIMAAVKCCAAHFGTCTHPSVRSHCS